MPPFRSAIFACLVAAGCVGPSGRAYPLYPIAGALPEPGAVAQLWGYVRYVDESDVSDHGSSFEVLPGCHLVGTPPRWGNVDLSLVKVTVYTGTVGFVLPMRPGYAYNVAVEVPELTAASVPARVVAYERDASGKVTATFARATRREELDECRARFAPVLP